MNSRFSSKGALPAALSILLSAGVASAALHVYEPVPLAGTGVYNPSQNLQGQRPTGSTVVLGFRNGNDSWGSGLNSAAIRPAVAGANLEYPAASLLVSQGGAFVVNGAINPAAGALNQRVFDFSKLPNYSSGSTASNFLCNNNGTSFYISALAKASDKTAWDAFPGYATFFGCGVNQRDNSPADTEASNSRILLRFPVDGVHFGFTSEGLEASVAGQRAVLIAKAALEDNETYLCVARIDVNAFGTQERVRAIAFPPDATAADLLSMPAQWPADLAANLFDNNKQFVYLNIGGATAPNVWFDEFRMTKNWLEAVYSNTPINISSASAAIIGGNVDALATLSATTPTNALYLCFGSRDFGPATNGWEVVVPWEDPAIVGAAQPISVPFSMLPQGVDLVIAAVAFDGAGGDSQVVGSVYVPMPTDCVWLGVVDNLASNALNWSTSLVPDANSRIVLNHASPDMLWNFDGVNGLTNIVASWTQAPGYTGTVTFPINYPDVKDAVFTNFTVMGDVKILGGTWTHKQNLGAREFRLAADIHGNFTLGASALLDATGKGYSSGSGAALVASHGGNANHSPATLTVSTYGDPKWPVDIGGYYTSGAKGGGAILLDVAGAALVNGNITANGTEVSGGGGAGGSILLRAQSLGGAGLVQAWGGSGTKRDTTSYAGSGGRIAIFTPAPFAMNTNNITACGRYTAGSRRGSGAGTVFLKTPADAHGTLVVNNRDPNNTSTSQLHIYGANALTPVNNGETWVFDRVIVANFGVVGVYANTTLVLPNGIESVSASDTARRGGLKLFGGGTLDIGQDVRKKFTLSGPWLFQSVAPFTFPGDVEVANGAAIGVHQLTQRADDGLANYQGCHVIVEGDLTVASGGMIDARSGGWWNTSATFPQAAHGGMSGWFPNNQAYGSVFTPNLPSACAPGHSTLWVGSGVVKLVVNGTLTLNGAASAEGLSVSVNFEDSSDASAGGSLDFTLGALEGSGSISVNGGMNSKKGGAGGGRVAVRLTNPNANFDTWRGRVTATGRTYKYTNTNTDYPNSSSAGTVYLETAADSAKGGLIIVRNDNNDNTPANLFTPLPATGSGGDAPADFKKAALSVEDYARVRLTASFQMQDVRTQLNTTLDLNGHTLSVYYCTLDGKPFTKKGVFTAAQLDGMGFASVVDSVGGGLLEIKPFPTLFLMR